MKRRERDFFKCRYHWHSQYGPRENLLTLQEGGWLVAVHVCLMVTPSGYPRITLNMLPEMQRKSGLTISSAFHFTRKSDIKVNSSFSSGGLGDVYR